MGYFEIRKGASQRSGDTVDRGRGPDIVHPYFYCNRCGAFHPTAYRIPGVEPFFYKIAYLETRYRWNTDALGLKCAQCGYARTFGEWKCSNPNGFTEKNLPSNASEGYEVDQLPEEQEIQRLNRQVQEAEQQAERKRLFLLLAAKMTSIIGLMTLVMLLLVAFYAFIYR
jgi:hypothetical protein